MSNLINTLLAACLLLISFQSFAEFSYSDVKNLPPIPKQYDTLEYQARLAWLKDQIEKSQQPLETYRLKRLLFIELYYANEIETAAKLCLENDPLREDILYRESCIIASYPEYEKFLPYMLELIHDARQFDNDRAAAQVLNDLAWRQSQHGDVAAAYVSYETALAIVPSDDIELLNTIMMDTATNYIVHGDQNYIYKGIELLKRTREQSLQALSDSTDNSEIAVLKDNILLTNFNTGIAYALHLFDYSKALEYFDKINPIESSYQISSLSFSALAAAETGEYERAKEYLNQISGKVENDPTIALYLQCYRELAIRHWDLAHPVSSCLNLAPETTVEVLLDVYKRLAESDDKQVELAGLKKLKALFINQLEPQLHSRGTQAASNTELRRLQRESELKSVVLAQQKLLQRERDETHAHRQNFFIALFVILIIFILLVAQQLRQKKKLATQFEQMSVRDSLTKLGNRRFLEQQIERELAYINRELRTEKNIALGIYLFDIDHFKQINDTYGHRAGDEVLMEIGKRISATTRDTDLLVRWGGEEFVYVARLDTNDRACQLADRILKAINGQPFEISGHDAITVTCTLGVVKYPFIDTDNIELWTRLISLADAALYYGKLKQRNCWVVINNENMVSKENIDELLRKPLAESVEEKLVTIKTSFD